MLLLIHIYSIPCTRLETQIDSGQSDVKPLLTHALQMGTIGLNSTPDFGASFSRRCTTSYIIDCLRARKAVNDVRSRALALKTGIEIWHRIYG